MRALPLLLLLVLVVPVLPHARAEDEPTEAAPQVAWFSSLAAARKIAEETGRPIFVAMHMRPSVASPQATERTRRWLQAYTDPAVVALSREMACVLRVNAAPEGQDPDVDPGAPAAIHLVIDPTSKLLARLDADLPPTRGVLERFLRRGLRNHGEVPPESPRISPGMVPKAKRTIEGLSPMSPVALSSDVPGLRLRLRWELPAPRLSGAGPKKVRARILMRWDEQGPFFLGVLEFEPGEEIDVPVDVRFDKIEGLAKLATKGLHRVDLYLEPDIGSFVFSQGPVSVGHLWIELGDGGGGGGGEQEQPAEKPEPKEEDEEQPDPQPEGTPEEPPKGPDAAKDDVIDPFVGEGETVDKEDAIVAVEDDDAGLKPPEQMPLEKALREFEKEREKAIGREGISPGERAFLRRYFELLQKHAAPKKDGAKKAKAPSRPGQGK